MISLRPQNANGPIWMPCPRVDVECPGLAYIIPLNELIVVKQRDRLHEIIGGKTVAYTIFNGRGEKVFLAVKSETCMKFDIKIFNYYGNEVIQVKRLSRLFLNKARVWAPPGNFVGSVEETPSCVNKFIVKNSSGEAVLKIQARGFGHFIYNIISNNTTIGEVTNHWRMLAMTDVQHFGVTFPEDLDVGDKVVLLGACFLIGCLKY